MEIIESKKAMSHVEIILSFVIFVGFLFFLLSIFNPFESFSREEVYMDVAGRMILNQTSTDVLFLSIRLNNPLNKDCFCFDYDLEDVVVKDESYSIVDALTIDTDNSVCIDDNGEFFFIYSNEYFDTDVLFDTSNCQNLKKEDKDYLIGLVRTYSMTSYDKLVSLWGNCSDLNNYINIKTNFGIPGSKDFAFSVRDTVGKVILNKTRESPKGTNVLAKNELIQLVYNDGRMEYAVVNIQVW